MSEQPVRVTPTKDGPLRVDGASAITKSDGTTVDMPERAFLCRCGGSSNKPFCDGTHARNGFSGDRDPHHLADERDHYAAGNLTIHDNRSLCAHAGACTDNLAAVFRLGTEPWIVADGATADEVIAVVQMCPSGALSYSLDGVEHRDRGGPTRLGCAAGGPYVVSGGVQLDDVELPDGATTDHLALCRCGASQNKPFCSGRHWYVDFDESTS